MSNLAKRIIEGESVDWLKPDKYGTTPLHKAAINGHLGQVPKDILTKENMLLKDNDGNTPLLLAAYNRQLDQLPKEILTKENMLIKDKYGITPLQCVAKDGSIDQVPIETLAQLKQAGELDNLKVEEPLSRKIVSWLISNTPYDPFDL